jgi:hypothetical protein
MILWKQVKISKSHDPGSKSLSFQEIFCFQISLFSENFALPSDDRPWVLNRARPSARRAASLLSNSNSRSTIGLEETARLWLRPQGLNSTRSTWQMSSALHCKAGWVVESRPTHFCHSTVHAAAPQPCSADSNCQVTVSSTSLAARPLRQEQMATRNKTTVSKHRPQSDFSLGGQCGNLVFCWSCVAAVLALSTKSLSLVRPPLGPFLPFSSFSPSCSMFLLSCCPRAFSVFANEIWPNLLLEENINPRDSHSAMHWTDIYA